MSEPDALGKVMASAPNDAGGTPIERGTGADNSPPTTQARPASTAMKVKAQPKAIRAPWGVENLRKASPTLRAEQPHPSPPARQPPQQQRHAAQHPSAQTTARCCDHCAW